MLAEMSSKNPENSPVFEDELTGVPVAEKVESEARDALVKVAEEGNQYSELKHHPAWKKLAGIIESQVKSLKARLVMERKYNNIMRIQEQIQTLEFLPNLVDSFVTDAEAAKEMLRVRFSDRE